MERAELKALLRGVPGVEARGGTCFLCDPTWSAAERAQAEQQMARPAERPDAGWLCVRTGGSAGAVKFARHDEATLSAAVDGFRRHFGLVRVNAIGVLPLFHVSGLMGWLRCATTGGLHFAADWRQLEAGEFPRLRGDDPWMLSLVPTQLQRLMASPQAVEWLRQFAVVFLGGGPVWPQLADAAAAARVRVALSYGLTETAAMVAAQRPEDFLAGKRDVGLALPHVQITTAADGLLAIRGDAVFRGYFPAWRESREFVTEDLGRIDSRGRIHVLGRRDALIITGGRKVNPVDVEAALRASGEFTDVAVIGLPDAEWGEAVVAVFPAANRPPDPKRASAGLPRHERPKRFVPVEDWPRNAQGKINRDALREVVRRQERIW